MTEALPKPPANITDMSCSSHPAERHVYVVFRPQAKKQLYCRDRFPRTKEKSNFQSHQHLTSALSVMLAPCPQQHPPRAHPQGCALKNIVFSLHVWVRARLPALLSRPWLCIMQAVPSTSYGMIWKQQRHSESSLRTFLGLSSGVRWDTEQKPILERTRGVQETVQMCSITGKGKIWALCFRELKVSLKRNIWKADTVGTGCRVSWELHGVTELGTGSGKAIPTRHHCFCHSWFTRNRSSLPQGEWVIEGRQNNRILSFFHVVSIEEGEGRCVVVRILVNGRICLPMHGITQGVSLKHQQRSWGWLYAQDISASCTLARRALSRIQPKRWCWGISC